MLGNDFLKIIFVFIGLAFFVSPVFSIEEPLEKSISASPSSARKGTLVTVTVRIKDSSELEQVILEGHRGKEKLWETQREVSGNSILLVWNDRPYSAGIYTYCAYLKRVNEQDSFSIGCFSVSICEDQCYPSGKTECYDKIHIRTCSDYNKQDPCLEWSSLKSCLGNTYCGYGSCAENQKPNWSCVDDFRYYRKTATCQYICQDDSGCGAVHCTDQCSSPGEVRCLDNKSKQTCNYFYDDDACLEWSSSQSCTGDSYCGYQNCLANQRPNWYCSNGECIYDCIDDKSCEIPLFSLPDPVIPPEVAPFVHSDEQPGIEISVFIKKESADDWGQSISLFPGEKLYVLLIIENKSQEQEFADLLLRVNMPKDIDYEKEITIGGLDTEGDIKKGIKIDFLPLGSEERISFEGKLSLEAESETELEMITIAELEDLSYFKRTKITVQESEKGVKWFLNKCYDFIITIFST